MGGRLPGVFSTYIKDGAGIAQSNNQTDFACQPAADKGRGLSYYTASISVVLLFTDNDSDHLLSIYYPHPLLMIESIDARL